LIMEVADKCIEMTQHSVKVCHWLRYIPSGYWCHLLNDKIDGQAINMSCKCPTKYKKLEESK
jgi:hypothetical protein